MVKQCKMITWFLVFQAKSSECPMLACENQTELTQRQSVEQCVPAEDNTHQNKQLSK